MLKPPLCSSLCTFFRPLFLVLFYVAVACAQQKWVDDRDPALFYNGTWAVRLGRGDLYNGGDTWSDTPGSTVAFTFSGSLVEYWGTPGPQNGQCSITIDGVDRGKIVAYSADELSPAMLFRWTEDAVVYSSPEDIPSANLSHRIIIGVGTDNTHLHGLRCELDYFVYTPHGAESGSSSTKVQDDTDDLDRYKVIVLPAILVPTVFALIVWCLWGRVTNGRLRQEANQLRETIASLRTPARAPVDVEAPPQMIGQDASAPESRVLNATTRTLPRRVQASTMLGVTAQLTAGRHLTRPTTATTTTDGILASRDTIMNVSDPDCRGQAHIPLDGDPEGKAEGQVDRHAEGNGGHGS